MELKSEKQKIRLCLAEMSIHWMPIHEIPEVLERKYQRGFGSASVIEYVRKSKHFAKAWSPGGAVLMASNRANVNHFANDDREAA
jgi:hypothetical protein